MEGGERQYFRSVISEMLCCGVPQTRRLCALEGDQEYFGSHLGKRKSEEMEEEIFQRESKERGRS